MHGRLLRFGEFELDRGRFELRSGGERVALQPLALRLLVLLVEERSRTVPVDELRDDLWPDVAVSDSSIYQVLKQLRQGLGDDAAHPRFVQTVRGFGYRFVAPVTTVDAADASPIRGRDSVLRTLSRRVSAAAEGNGGVLFLPGEAGLGKSRIAREIANRASTIGVATHLSSALPAAGRSFSVWIDAMERLDENMLEPDVRGLVTRLRSDLENPGETTPIPSNQRAAENTHRLAERLAQVLERIGTKAPLLLVLDDLHRADLASLNLLSSLTERIKRLPVLILATYRPGDLARQRSHAEIVFKLSEPEGNTISPLCPLDTTEILAILVNEVPQDARSTAALEQLALRSRGNPFFALEILRYAFEDEMVPMDDVGQEVDVTTSVRAVLSTRFDAIGLEARRCLRAASAIGPRISRRRLIAAFGTSDVDEIIATLCSHSLLLHDPARSGAYQFPHDLVREAIHAELTEDPNEFREVHRRLAEFLINEESVSPELIAHHVACAVPRFDPEKAVEFLRTAADRSAATEDDDRAWSLYQQALSVIRANPSIPPDLQCGCLIGVGTVGVRGPRGDEARGYLRRAIAIARSHDLPESFCRAALGLTYRDEITGAHETDVAALLQEALSDFARESLPMRSRLLSALARATRYEAFDGTFAIEASEEAIHLARESQDASALARALEDACFIRWSGADVSDWTALNRDLVEAASEADDVGLLFRGLKGLATAHMEAGDHRAMMIAIDRCRDLADRIRSPFFLSIVALHAGALAFLRGDLEAGESIALDVLKSEIPAASPVAAVQLFYHRLCTSRENELESAIRGLLAESPEIETWRYALARLLAGSGRLKEGRAELKGCRRLEQIPRDRHWLAAGALGIETAILVGESELVEELFGTLEPHADVNIVLGHGSLFYGNTAYWVGRAAAAIGDLAAARTHLEKSLAMHRRMQSPPWISLSEKALADLD